jgi:hypothetical protein
MKNRAETWLNEKLSENKTSVQKVSKTEHSEFLKVFQAAYFRHIFFYWSETRKIFLTPLDLPILYEEKYIKKINIVDVSCIYSNENLTSNHQRFFFVFFTTLWCFVYCSLADIYVRWRILVIDFAMCIQQKNNNNFHM